jgi:zinc and cadmium transporter
MNHSTTMLCLYAGAAFLASLAGGSLPSLVRLTHTRMQTAISFIGGLMLGMALLHMIPHAAEETHSLDRTVAWALGGFLVMFFLQRAFHYHQHGVPGDAASGPGHGAGCGHNHAVVTAPEDLPGATRKLSWAGVSLGLGFHSLLDGLALAAAVTAESRSGVGLVGLGTALAVILHKPFDALAVMTLMQSSGCSARLRRGMNITIALIAPLGVALAFLGLGEAAEANHVLLGCALGFCAGGFLCIACSDLLPELHFHAHDRLRLSLALLAGLGVSILVGAFEGDGHGHGQEQETNQHQHNTHQTIP